MKNIGVILAGGKGTRFGSSIPKQFIRVAGKQIIEHTISTFQDSNYIDEIAVVTHKGYINDIKEIVNKNNFSKVRKILNGGSTRNESSLSAINAYWQENNKEETNLIFHDAVRPFISERILRDINSELSNYNAIDVAVPSTDTIIEVKNSVISNIPDRNNLMNGQTPQAFYLPVIKKAYDIGMNDPNFKATDDCGVIKKYLPKEKIFVVEGEETNIKITHELDLFIADKIFQILKKEIYANNQFEQLKDKVLVVFGGNNGIGAAVADIAEKYGATTFRESRSLSNTDICNVQDVKKALKNAFDKCGKIDYVVNSAAILDKQPLAQMEYDNISQSLNTNIKGAIIIAKESYPYLKKSKGQLLNYTSSSYTRGRSFYSIYSATKTAIVNLTQALAEEWEKDDICVNCINPERTKTPMRERNFGIEPENSLLKAETVAITSINALLSRSTGQLFYVKRMKQDD